MTDIEELEQKIAEIVEQIKEERVRYDLEYHQLTEQFHEEILQSKKVLVSKALRGLCLEHWNKENRLEMEKRNLENQIKTYL